MFREMRLSDVDQVLEIDRLSFPNPWPAKSYHYEVTENENSRAWVAVDDASGKVIVIAMAVIWIILDEAHIGTIAVHPDYRGKGLGFRFLSETMESAKKEGVIKAFLEVRKSNIAAIAIYEHLAFVVDGVRKGYYRDNQEDALLMSCDLTNKLEYNANDDKIA